MEWIKLHNGELNDLFRSPNIIRVIKLRRMRGAGHVACMGGEERRIQIFGMKPEGKRPLGGPRCKWDDNIKMIIRKWDGGYELDLSGSGKGQVALVTAVMNHQLP